MKNFIIVIIAIILLGINNCYADEISDLIPYIIAVESSGNPTAISEDGCIGLMQISPIILNEQAWSYIPTRIEKQRAKIQSKDTNYQINVQIVENIGTPKQSGIQVSDLFNPQTNVEIGTWYLRRIWNHYLPHYNLEQSIENLIISYHDGPKNCWKYRQGKRKLGPNMRSYLKRVMRLYKESK